MVRGRELTDGERPGPLEPGALEQYRRDGYLVLPPEALGADVVGTIERLMPALLADDSPRRVLERDGVTVRSVYGVHQTTPEIADITRRPALLGAIEQLLGDDVYVHQSKINIKAPLSGDQWEWHQDYIYWLQGDGLERPDLINVAVFLDEVTEFNGPLTVIPGSHRHGVLAGSQKDGMPLGYEDAPAWVATLTAEEQFKVQTETIEALARENGLVSPKGPAGSVLLFHPNILHSSSQNISPFRRAMLIFVYNAVGNTARPVAEPRPPFLAEPNVVALQPLAAELRGETPVTQTFAPTSTAPSRPGISERDLEVAFPDRGAAPDMDVRLSLMSRLYAHYSAYLAGPEHFERIPRLNSYPMIARIEDQWIRWEDAQVDSARLPETAAEFHDWFLALSAEHTQPDFCRYIAEDATQEEVALFFLAEELVDGRFDDLVAMAQLGAAASMKLVLGENYWDEMGGGQLERMHTRLFDHSAKYMRDRLANSSIDLAELHCAEVYENACLTLMYGIHRPLVPRSLGALGLMEHSAPPRFEAMVAGCTRLGVPADVIEYQRIHVHVDEDHGAEWLEQVLTPLAAQSPAMLREICMGILTRERVANAYYQRVWQQMKALR